MTSSAGIKYVISTENKVEKKRFFSLFYFRLFFKYRSKVDDESVMTRKTCPNFFLFKNRFFFRCPKYLTSLDQVGFGKPDHNILPEKEIF